LQTIQRLSKLSEKIKMPV